MTQIICNVSTCKHRSKRPLLSWKTKNGNRCYGCTLDCIVINRIFDMDGDICAIAGEENMAHCMGYEPEDD